MDSPQTSVSVWTSADHSEIGIPWKISSENWTRPVDENRDDPSHSTSVSLLNAIAATLWNIVPPVLLVLGTFGNVMIVAVMRGMRASPSTACLSLYFTALAVSDQCLLVSSSLWFWVDLVFSWPPAFFRHNLLCTIPYFMWYTCSLTSAWFLVSMTYQRVTAVVAPHRVVLLCTVRRGKVVIAAIVVLACVLNSHFLFMWVYKPELGKCKQLKRYTEFVQTYTLVDTFLASVIPFTLLIIGNTVLIGKVIKSARLSGKMKAGADFQERSKTGQHYSMTVTLIMTSSAFLMLTLPNCVIDIYLRGMGNAIIYDHFGAVLHLAETVTLLLWFSVSASNFYLYLLSGRKFREEAKRSLCWRCTGPK